MSNHIADKGREHYIVSAMLLWLVFYLLYFCNSVFAFCFKICRLRCYRSLAWWFQTATDAWSQHMLIFCSYLWVQTCTLRTVLYGTCFNFSFLLTLCVCISLFFLHLASSHSCAPSLSCCLCIPSTLAISDYDCFFLYLPLSNININIHVLFPHHPFISSYSLILTKISHTILSHCLYLPFTNNHIGILTRKRKQRSYRLMQLIYLKYLCSLIYTLGGLCFCGRRGKTGCLWRIGSSQSSCLHTRFLKIMLSWEFIVVEPDNVIISW